MAEKEKRLTWRRWITPALCVLVSVVGVALPALWERAEFDPAPLFLMMLFRMWAIILSVLVVLAWFFLFGGFSRRVRLTAVGLMLGVLVLLVGAGFALVGEVDWTGDLRPIPRFRWEPRGQTLLERYQKQGETGDDLPAIDLTINAVSDFPRYRGAQGDGIVTPPELLATDWETQPPKILWRKPCGGGFAGFAVAGNVAITLEQRRDQEALVCYDRATGRERWVHDYPAHFRDVFGDGPRATPTIHDGHLYSYGGTGVLCCVDGTTGEEVWSVDTMKDCKAKVVTWGMSGSPLVVADLNLVIVNPGIDPKNNAEMALAAYDLKTGSRRWAAGGHAAGYSSPLLATLAGRRQVVIFDAGGLAGFDVTSGEELWRHPWDTFQEMNIIQPILTDGDRLFLSSETSNGCALLKVAKTDEGYNASIVWDNKYMASKFSNPLAVGGAIFGLNQGTMVCLDQQTGKRRWRGKHYGHGQILAVGGAILVLSERGYVALVAADPARFKELGRLEVFKDKTWNTPALTGRHLFVRNAREMACIELPLRE